MRWLWIILVGVGLLALDVGVVCELRGLGGGPDLMLLFVIFLALYGPMDDAPISGWLLGLAKDSLSTGSFGLYAVLYMAIAFFLSRVRADIFLEYNISHAVNAAVSTLVVYLGACFWHWTQDLGFAGMAPVALGVSLWNAALAPPVFYVLFRFSRLLDVAARPG